MDQVSEVKSLAAKMATIMGEVPTMIKNGEMSGGGAKYKYITAEDVKAALRPLLKKHNVALFSQMIDVQRETSVNKNQTVVVTVIAKMCFTLMCGDTGDKMDCLWYGESNDYADKGVNKAATAAEKYFLINTFMLSTTEPDADEEPIEITNHYPAPAQQPAWVDPRTPLWEKVVAMGEGLYGNDWLAQRNKRVRSMNTKAKNYLDLTYEEIKTLWDQLEEETAAEAEPAPA